MRSGGGVITSRVPAGSLETKREKRKRLKQEQEILKIRRRSAKSILRAALRPTAPNPPDLDEPEDLVESASTIVTDEYAEEAATICSCRAGCPTCKFIHTVEAESLVLEAP